MKIIVTGNGQNINLNLPTNLILSPAIAWVADKACGAISNERIAKVSGHAVETMSELPQDAVAKLFAELRRIKKKYGTWELVEVTSADGEYVKITL